MSEVETWENATAGRVSVKKFNAQGLLRDELVASGRTVHLTPQERRINQELAANENLDVFQNGVMQPVRLLDGTEDAKEIAENPNHISDSDITALVKGHHKTLEARLRDISNPSALQRMYKSARAADASVSKVEMIKARLQEVAPSLFEEVTPAGGPPVDAPRTGGIKAVTPR